MFCKQSSIKGIFHVILSQKMLIFSNNWDWNRCSWSRVPFFLTFLLSLPFVPVLLYHAFSVSFLPAAILLSLFKRGLTLVLCGAGVQRPRQPAAACHTGRSLAGPSAGCLHLLLAATPKAEDATSADHWGESRRDELYFFQRCDRIDICPRV